MIGIDDYEVQPLQACVRDAEDIAQLLREEDYYGFDVTICTNAKASLIAIRQGIDELFKGDPDVAVFYFAGHGIMTDLGGYLVTHDWQTQVDPGLSLEILSRLIQVRAKPSTSVIVVLDCCHSGAAKLRDILSEADTDLWRDINVGVVKQSVRLGQGNVVLAACKPDESAVELSKEGHGVFTYHLLNGLLGEAANHEGKITPISLYDYVSHHLSKSMGQTPVFSGDLSGRIILGEGFPERQQDIEGNELQRIVRKAHGLMDEYLSVTSRTMNDEEWRASGFKEACARLEPVVEWQKQKIAEYKMLKTNPEFRRATERASAELSRLGMLYTGIRTNKGLTEQRLGSGTFGTVWKVRTITEGLLAYKVYNTQELALEDKVTRFRRGYQAMKRLEHPQVVRVSEFTECPIGFYMDYIEGPNLREFAGIEQSASETLEHLLTIADTLRHAHDKGVVHRDVKPENILMQYNSEAKKWIPFLTDFDLAWFSAASQVTKVGMGAFAYAAPEQFAQPGAAISHAKTTDIYAFGQLAFFELTRSDPMPGAFDENARVLGERLREWPDAIAAQKFVNLYKQCSQLKPDQRIQSFDQIWSLTYQIFTLLSQPSENRLISLDEFLFQVRFGVIGLQDGNGLHNNTSFYSLNQLTSVDIAYAKGRNNESELDLDITFAVQGRLALDSVSNEQARIILSRRIDDMLQNNFAGAIRKSGNRGSFETIIKLKGQPITVAGAFQISQIMKRVIDILER